MRHPSRWAAAALGLLVGSFGGIPAVLAVICLAPPLYILWVVFIDRSREDAGKPPGWRKREEEAEILQARNSITSGPRTTRRGRRP